MSSLLFKIQQIGPRFVSQHNLTSNAMSQIKTFVFLDLETTGLPHLEHNLTRITELCAVAVQANHIELGCFPRIQNKLSFCFNPRKMISPETTDITGLSNHLLEHQAVFSSDVVDIFKKWLEMNQQPICLVAHNGNRFDYPIFKAEITKTGNCLPDHVLCIDSLAAFRQIDAFNKSKEETKQNTSPQEVPFEFQNDFNKILCEIGEDTKQDVTPEKVQKMNETTPQKQMISSQTQASANETNASFSRSFHTRSRECVSYKLQDVYTRLTSRQPISAHEAEADVFMLIMCAATYGEKFVAYANENLVKFSDIPAMKPGKRIGT